MFESHYISANANANATTTTTTTTSAASNSRHDFRININMNTSLIAATANASATGSVSRKTSMSESQQLPLLLQQLTLGEFAAPVSDEDCPICFQAKRHQETIEGLLYERHPWRILERMKTASVALVLCLNIGVDPPDVVKIQPCARLECWVDPSSVSAPKAMEQIGANLQKQYERWQPRARYKKCHDPTVEDVKKLCTSLRRNAKGERILFHYNGHGVPKPTANGEIWVFNKTFTQYIPLSIFELQGWMAAPSIYVYDCSNAGIIINSFLQFAEQHERDFEKAIAANQRIGPGQPPPQLPPLISYKNCIHLAACSANEILPMNAQLPADLFTSCLTTPIIIALNWYVIQEKHGLVPKINSELIDKIPGQVNDRRTMKGELNWIFTAITDTIAWNVLPRELFQRLFRQDLLVASLFRNFLLAERILRSHDCIPVSHPALPSCYRHHMWSAWDLVVDLALQQLPDILEKGVPYRQLPFFEEQLTAFQVWLDHESESRTPPEQLPIVLQVLLSQVHRLRALDLLARFLDLGPWAVNLALGVGIFPYVLKLLQSSTKELRPVLVFIWAKILAVDATCQVDLVQHHKYFLSVLQDGSVPKEYRTLSAFVLSLIVNNFLLGQTSALQGPLLSICLEQLNDSSWLLRQWLAICLGMLWQNFEKARWSGVRDLAHEKLYPLLKDAIPEVRAAAVFALGTFISSVTDRSEEHANNIDRIIAITLLETVGEDMSPLVRLELAVSLQWMVVLFKSQFVCVYMAEYMNTAASLTTSGERSATITHVVPPVPNTSLQNSTHSLERHVSMRRGVSSSSICSSILNLSSSSIPFHSIFVKLLQGITNLANDPFPKVAETAQKIIDSIRDVVIVTAKEATTEKCSSLSVSLPPSPNTRVNFLNSDSPPAGSVAGIVSGGGSQTAITQQNVNYWAQKLRMTVSNEPQAMLQRKQRTTSMNDETDSCAPLSGGSGSVVNECGKCSSARSSTSETNYEHKSQCLKPIVTSEFIPWAISYFTRPGKNRYASEEASESVQVYPIDKDSTEYRTREYRAQRNRTIRQQGREQNARVLRIDTQCYVRKTQFTPSLVKLVPYESQIAIAYRDKVLVHDWSRNVVRSCTPSAYMPNSTPRKQASASGGSSSSSSSSPPTHAQQTSVARVSTIEFLNAHDVSLVLAGHEDGVVRVWEAQTDDTRESRLVTAFEGLPRAALFNTGAYAVGTAAGAPAVATTTLPITTTTNTRRRDMGTAGILTTWQQYSEQLVVAGGSCRYMRIWDLERELKLCDIPIGGDTHVRVLSPFPCNMRSELIVAGCGDGSVRLFDKRCAPQEARIRNYRQHSRAILAACLKENQTTLVTGCTQGKVCTFDLRTNGGVATSGIVHQFDAGNDVTAIACHQSAEAVVCGSANKITIYSLDGRTQNVVRSNEGFMGSKLGHPTCLSFHPFKAALAFYKLCQRWEDDVNKNPRTFMHVEKFLEEPEMLDAIDNVKRKTQLHDLTMEDVQLMYRVCSFETAWHRQREPSIWCSLFNDKTIKALEFAADLKYYWKDGYGYNLTHKIACPAIANMFVSIDPNSSLPNATIYFSHSGTMLKLLSHMGLYNDPTQLTFKDFKRQRAWRTSAIDAFASNLAFVLYDCPDAGPKVLTLHQERAVRLPGCPQDTDLCDLQTLRHTYADSLHNCNFEEICHK